MAIPFEENRRLHLVVVILHWLTLALGTFLVFVGGDLTTSTYGATAAGGLYVVLATALPTAIARKPTVREAVAVVGSLLTMTAVGLTDSASSPFLLLALTPILYTASSGGFRLGLGTAALSSGILSILVIPTSDPVWNNLIEWIVVFFLVAVTFGYVHRLFVEQVQWTAAVVAASAEYSARLERLETANQLLTRLAEQAATAELNPIEVGNAALESARSVVPFEAATVSLATDGGPVAVARIGNVRQESVRSSVPLRVGERDVGIVAIASSRKLTERQQESLEAALQPAALAFANILLLQSIAKTAIREERSRLARELHDEIGPSLASLGLALDLASLEHPTEPALATHLQQLRLSVASLVDDVRTTVADLRHPQDGLNLRDAVLEVVRNRGDSAPRIDYQVHESRPIRPALVADINAFVVEALRNAIQHANASTIQVVGTVDFDSGELEIVDNGNGFDSTSLADGRFGLLGMRERAARLGAFTDIESGPKGTKVSLRWGER